MARLFRLDTAAKRTRMLASLVTAYQMAQAEQAKGTPAAPVRAFGFDRYPEAGDGTRKVTVEISPDETELIIRITGRN